ncbi:peptidase S9 prolyl oligopeptidase active site domain protein [Kribbella flavida DSM 17836]|uniref:Peptidase S9 prolyl oligopeptidase active site domain protein n=1 Tax=Kribbella flavida (strain DSM 17836 / JCM 10339 / NBRC 14399) TaxID=479435 RepID=D2PRK2_KRIFD|nr:prolyl oligopeptidase family serine peptidase [Kribbella flavida]ADB34920.1 peptidase S9 prolyl oligopeptidase active site domain protein [Kribbella flavida DSM 17836]
MDTHHTPALSPAEAYPAQSARTQRFSLGLPRAFTVAPDGERVLFLRTRGPEDRASCLWLLDGTGERLLVAPEHLGDDGPVPEAERIRRERARERSGGVVAYSADTALQTVVFAVNGRLWHLDLATEALRRLDPAGPVVDPRLDPTGRRVAYVTDGSLHVLEIALGNDQRVAGDDDPLVGWGLAEHVAAESMNRTRGHWWSPGGDRLLAARVDLTPVQRWWIADPANPRTRPREIRYPAAGTANALVSLHVLDLSGTTIDIDWDRETFEYLVSAAWDRHGPLISVQSRDQRTLHVLSADPSTGLTEVLHEQRDTAWVQLLPGTPARTAFGKLVVPDDTPHTRRLLVDGQPATPDGLQLHAVLDVTAESVLFEASSEPTERHVWSHDPAGLRRLTDTPGVHTATRTGDTLVLTANTETGRSFAVRRDGRPDQEIRSLAAAPVLTPRITWMSAGEQELRTALVLPSWYEPGTTLPVLMAPYAGPAMQIVVRATTPAYATAQWYAEAGFAVVIADGRGTPGRGPAWEKTVRGDTLSAPLEDQVIALHAAAEYCPDLDLTRVGIIGWSYGGTLAVAAVLRRPDVFHAAVSGAGPSDQRLYDTHWRERFLGHPDDNPEAYDRSSPIADAANLSRPLLLVHGLADDNVVAAHTLRLSAALLAAGRPHQVLPLSGAGHAPTDEAAVEGLMRHQLHFLKTALQA